MTDEEKKDNPQCETTGGYLKIFDYQDTFRASWDKLTNEEKAEQYDQLKKLPNYDENVFEQIAGFRPGHLMK